MVGSPPALAHPASGPQSCCSGNLKNRKQRGPLRSPILTPPPSHAGTQPFSNPLLVRVELAKCKPTTYDLPGSGHTFGKALERDSEDAGAGPSAPQAPPTASRGGWLTARARCPQ